MKNYFYSVLVALFAVCAFSGCSDDDDNSNSGSASTLKMNGTPIKIYSNVDGEWDSRDGFDFWVNGIDVTIHDDGVYIQGKISRTDEDIRNSTLTINVGEDVTDRFSILLEYKHGNGFITGWGKNNDEANDYLSGKVKVKSIDKTKHILTLDFDNLTYDSTNDDDTSIDKVTLTGTLDIPYEVIME